MGRETWREGKKERTRKEEERDKELGTRSSISDWFEICDMYIEYVCFPVSTCVDCVIFSYCERIDAVHAKPAGGDAQL